MKDPFLVKIGQHL